MSFGADRAVVFIGFMGAGKSTAARAAAEALATEMVDVDRVVEERLGSSLEQVFAERGEAAFRAAEEQVTLELLQAAPARVFALGGGAVLHQRVRAALADHLVIWLDVAPEAAWSRVAGSGRPLARDQASFERLHSEREPLYASLADVTVPVERGMRIAPVLEALAGVPRGVKMLWGGYPAYIGRGLLIRERFWPKQVDGRRFLVTDEHVEKLYADALEPLAGRIALAAGERSKTLANAELVWTGLAETGITREDLVLALGGGVVGDLAGFCAATYQRGIRYLQVPTSLVAHVDSAYGGKTGVDLAQAKNYVGAYHHPAAVIADLETLNSLPAAELAAGFAEVLKTALIAGGELWERVRSGADPVSPEVITACVRAKLRIVSRDERDAGARQVLNLGHTVGHAIEAATGYARYRHGEAVGLGLLAALRLSGQPELREDVGRLLAARGLPTTLDGVDPEAVVLATTFDKKRLGDGHVPFVLVDSPGQVRPGNTVSEHELAAAVRELAQ